MAWQLCRFSSRRLPRITHDFSTSWVASRTRRLVRRTASGWFPGAACCLPIDLQTYKAAPLPTLAIGTTWAIGDHRARSRRFLQLH
jgi:hypothetical protein